ncbi:hypothetical protein BDQ17DRAFT_1332466 [Cyathus striatus]|nr:hypothetical protein BDQ17DRAFT_1332466 [Cyathus striatus]
MHPMPQTHPSPSKFAPTRTSHTASSSNPTQRNPNPNPNPKSNHTPKTSRRSKGVKEITLYAPAQKPKYINRRAGLPPDPIGTLHIRSLVPETTEDDLKVVFEPYGVIEAIQIERRLDGQCNGHAYVAYTTFEESSAAFLAHERNAFDLYGHKLNVEHKDDKDLTPLGRTTLKFHHHEDANKIKATSDHTPYMLNSRPMHIAYLTDVLMLKDIRPWSHIDVQRHLKKDMIVKIKSIVVFKSPLLQYVTLVRFRSPAMAHRALKVLREKLDPPALVAYSNLLSQPGVGEGWVGAEKLLGRYLG